MLQVDIPIEIEVNGKKHLIRVSPETTLLNVLRDHLYLKGSKKGCNQGQCGACTVIMDGKAVNACLVLAPRVDGAHITTIEGLYSQGRLHPLQDAFVQEGAVQCGFCTPGMIMSAKALLDENENPDEKEIRLALSGNLCRCTGYEKIVKAVQRVAKHGGRES